MLCAILTTLHLQRNITRSFDLKGSSRARYVDLGYKVENFDEVSLAVSVLFFIVLECMHDVTMCIVGVFIYSACFLESHH